MADQLTNDWTKLDNRVRFVIEIIEGKLIVQNRKRNEIIEELKRREYQTFAREVSRKNGQVQEEEDGSEREELMLNNKGTLSSGYDYLLNMPIYSLTLEKIEKLKQERTEKEAQLNHLLAQTPKDLWRQDLDAFMIVWQEYEQRINDALEKARNGSTSIATKSKRGESNGNSLSLAQRINYMLNKTAAPTKSTKSKLQTTLDNLKNVKTSKSITIQEDIINPIPSIKKVPIRKRVARIEE